MNKELYQKLLEALQRLLTFIGEDSLPYLNEDEREVANSLHESREVETIDELSTDKLFTVLELLNKIYRQAYAHYEKEKARQERLRGIRRAGVITGESSPLKEPSSTGSPLKIEPLQISAIEEQQKLLVELSDYLSELKQAWSNFVKLEDDNLSKYLEHTSLEYKRFIHYVKSIKPAFSFLEYRSFIDYVKSTEPTFPFEYVIIPQVFTLDLLKAAFNQENSNLFSFNINNLKNTMLEFYPNRLKDISQEAIKNKTLLVPYAPAAGQYVLLCIKLNEHCQAVRLDYYDSIKREEDAEGGNPRAESRNDATQTILGISYFDLMEGRLSPNTSSKFKLHAEDKQSRDLISLDACAYFVIDEILRKILAEARNALQGRNISKANRNLKFAHLSDLIASVLTHQSNSGLDSNDTNTLFLEALPRECKNILSDANNSNKEQTQRQSLAASEEKNRRNSGQAAREAEKKAEALARIRQSMKEAEQRRVIDTLTEMVKGWMLSEQELQKRVQAVSFELGMNALLDINILTEQLNKILESFNLSYESAEDFKNKLNGLIKEYYEQASKNIKAISTSAKTPIVAISHSNEINNLLNDIRAVLDNNALANLNRAHRYHEEAVHELEILAKRVNVHENNNPSPMPGSAGELSATAMASNVIKDAVYINLYPVAVDLYEAQWERVFNCRNQHEVHSRYSQELANAKAVIHRSVSDYEFTISTTKSKLTQAAGFIAKATPAAQKGIDNLQDEITTLYCMIEQTISNMVLSGIPLEKINLRLKGSEAATTAGANYAKDYFGINESKISKLITRYPLGRVVPRLLPEPENIKSILQLLEAKKAGKDKSQPRIVESIGALTGHLNHIYTANASRTLNF